MKISQRVLIFSIIAGVSLVTVSGIGTYSLSTIGQDVDLMNNRVTPLQTAITRVDGASERVMSTIIEMTRADTEDKLAATSEAAARRRSEMDALREIAVSLDGSLDLGGYGLEAYEETVRDLMSKRLESFAKDEQARQDASRSMLIAKEALKRVSSGAATVSDDQASEMAFLRESAAEMTLQQREALRIEIAVLDLENLANALTNVKNKFKIGPIRERFTALADRFKRFYAADVAGDLMQTHEIDPAAIDSLFLAPDTGLFALREAGLKDRSAERSYRKAMRGLLKDIDGWRAGLAGDVDSLSVELAEMNGTIDDMSSGESLGQQASTSTVSLELLMSSAEKALSQAILATDLATVEQITTAQETNLKKVRDQALELAEVFTQAGFAAYAEKARELAGTSQPLFNAIRSMSEGRGALLASNQQLENTLRDLRNFVAQERERSAGQIDKVEAEKKEISAAIDSETQLAYTTMIGVSAAAITLLIIMSVLIVRTIHVRLQKAVTMAQEVANGDLIKSGPVQGNDEIADLMRAMAAMVDMLSSAVMRIHTSAGAVRHGVSEISTGNAELNERTTEQAAGLNETAAAIAQVSTIAGEGATSAESAAGRSATANEAAAQGREIMMQAMRSMNDVQSGAVEIKNIIEVINSIAFQTNILALNAAVEAARAGEQGRGFAVVASEVRSLASKSADAAQEIGRIITRNVEQVETGSALVTEAGEQIDKIATEISETVELIRKISDGSTEQAGAVNEVNETIGQLEESTQQNASLAEQISGAADSLVEQAQVLEDAVDVFRVEAG